MATAPRSSSAGYRDQRRHPARRLGRGAGQHLGRRARDRHRRLRRLLVPVQRQCLGRTQGFAIPINTALSIARAIEAGHGSSTVHIGETAFLGVEINAASSSSGSGGGSSGGRRLRQGSSVATPAAPGNTGNSGSSASGASVASTVTNGPAQEAGLAEGDVITSLGRQDHQLRQRPHQRHQPSTTQVTR